MNENTIKHGTGLRFLTTRAVRRLMPGLLGLALTVGVITESSAGIIYNFQGISNSIGFIDLPSLSGNSTIADVFFSYRAFGDTFTHNDNATGASWDIDSDGNLLNLVFGAIKLDIFPGSQFPIQSTFFGGINAGILQFTNQDTGAILSQEQVSHSTMLTDDGGLLNGEGPPPVPNDPPIAVPEPGTLLLLGIGLVIVAFSVRSKRRRNNFHFNPGAA